MWLAAPLLLRNFIPAADATDVSHTEGSMNCHLEQEIVCNDDSMNLQEEAQSGFWELYS